MNPPPSRRRATPPSWSTYRQSIGDRSELFAGIADAWSPARALYLGSYLDASPSTAIASVIYVDLNRRAARYFADEERVAAELKGHLHRISSPEVRFVHADYTKPLPVPEASFDLVISLYAGPVWGQCDQYFAPRGLFLANASHGDASLAALDPRLELVAAVHSRDGRFRIDRDQLDSYLIPKKPADADPALIRSRGRGIAYTRSAFAYLFRYAPAG
ncbi:hypothetical protein HT102_06050 [Hoyosella sp. G463]|uniref:Uncharacterized protein n=1 Tax=Lolliginicoccus lacisalsi TaxID=2742202 RepID=A0A927PLQ1_9ACTN|nr:hypothetical protein [Lolliginicoccus lacisalsi]MBD8506044.1 hypothetical protein [Lolliginicoccus lacisalsi]